jgi:hypothetical protein
MADSRSKANSSAPSTRKKVVVRRLDKGLLKGYVDPANYLNLASVQVLGHEGRLTGVPLEELKGIFFVRDFEGNPQHLERKVFRSRPKLSGLWVRLSFHDNEILEGIIPNNLLELDARGFLFTPLDVHSNNVKVFVPRGALSAVEVLGVISDGAARRSSLRGGEGRQAGSTTQIGLLAPARQPETK